MKIVKKLLAIALCLTMLLGIIPFGMMGVSAVGEDAVKSTLNSIMKCYGVEKGKKGKFFNTHPDTACKHPVDSKGNITYHGCNDCNLKNIITYNKKHFNIGEHAFVSGSYWTCYAFASYCFTMCFNKPFVHNNYTYYTSIGSAKGSNASDIKKLFSKASVGDVIQWGYDSSYSHFGIVYEVASDGVYVLDGNGQNAPGIGSKNASMVACSKFFYDRYRATDDYDFGTSTIIIKHAKNYDSVVQSCAAPTKETENTDNGVKVQLKSTTSGRTIYYTTDGSAPTTPNSKTTNKSSVKYDEGSILITKTTTIKAIAYKSGFADSSVATFKITVNKLSAPQIASETTANGFNVTIKANSGETIYYTTDGTNPTTSSTKYTSGIVVTENTTIKAIVAKSGCANSDVASLSLTASVPTVPQNFKAQYITIGVGDEAQLSWKSVEGAASYKLVVSGAESEEIDVGNVTVYSYITNKAGTYSFSVKAVNFKGESAASSPAVNVTVKSDVTVTFKVNGSTYATQTIRYNSSAAEPAAPTVTGYDFDGWDKSFNNVTSNITVNAKFKAQKKTIKFLKEDGSILSEQSVEFGKSASVPTAPAKDGYVFSGWTQVSGDGTSYTEVDGDADFKPVYAWATPSLPVAVTVSSAVRADDSRSYAVSIKVTNSKSQKFNARAIAVIKTANDKVVATAIQNIEIPANASSKAYDITVNSNESAMLCEVYIVNGDADNADLTGGALSAKASKAVTKNASTTVQEWSAWSDWSDTAVEKTTTRDVETKTQYMYRDKETTTAKTASLEGWTQTGKDVTYGKWSAWDDVVLTANATTEVQKAVIYRYYYYACASCGNRQPYWNCACTKCGKHVDNSKRDYMCSDVSYSKVSSSKYDDYKRVTTQFDNGKKWFFSSGNLNDTKVGTIDAAGSAQVIFNGYRKRTITTTYSFERWTEWSAWSDSKYTAVDNSREVKMRTVYRYRTLTESTSTASTEYVVTENTSGTSYSVSGNIANLNKDYSGQKATVMVYRGNVSDPTASQLEYVGQITLGSNNSYSFSFIPKEPLSSDTGDFTVSLGIASADKLVNTDKVEAPKQKYKVEFQDLDGKTISTQNVEQGKDAVPPTLPSKDGYIVTWSAPCTNINKNTTIKAQKTAITYSVVFVDWANSEVLSIQDVEYGSTPRYPSNPTAEGKVFKGWSLDSSSKITETTVIEAIYDDITYTVNFLNKDGTVYESVTVPYGGYAAIPKNNPTAEGFEFVAWDSSSAWWDIKADASIKPIFIYDSTVETPVATNDTVNFRSAVLDIETATEGAEIYYTTDGSEPTQESFLFDDIVFVEQTTTFKAKAFKDGMNDSATAEFVIEVLDESESPAISALMGDEYITVGETTATVCARIDNPQEYNITDMGLYVTDAETGETKTIKASPLPTVTNKPVGSRITINNLEKGTTYEYEFFIIFDVNGEEYYLSTGPKFAGDSVDSFTTLGEKPVNPGDDDPDDPVVPAEYSVKIKTPSTTTVKYGYTLVLHAEVEGTLPEGAKVVWKETSGEAFKATASGLTAKATSTVKGEKTITVCIVDADGNVLKNENGEAIQDSVTLTAKVSFFTKLAYFFKHLFGANLTIDA